MSESGSFYSGWDQRHQQSGSRTVYDTRAGQGNRQSTQMMVGNDRRGGHGSEAQNQASIRWLEDENRRLKGQMQLLEDRIKLKINEESKSQEHERYHKLEMQRRIDDLTTQVSSKMNTSMSQNESSVENINIRNRPITVAEEYTSICSNEWHSAKEALDRYSTDEKQKISVLTAGFMIAEELANDMKKRVYSKMNQLLTEPIISTCTSGNAGKMAEGKGYKLEVSDEFRNNVGDLLRVTSEKADVGPLFEEIIPKWKAQTRNFFQCHGDDRLQKFIRSCTSLAWKMVIQRPPMRFDQSDEGKTWNEKMHEPFWGSNAHSKAKIFFYVHPALFHGEGLMVKGKVLVQ